MFLFMALLLPFSVQMMRADDKEAVIEIPIYRPEGERLGRTFVEVQAFYLDAMPSIQTSVFADLGEIEVSVTNCSTGEMWYDTFDSGLETQNILQISGSSGLYEVTYITFSGDVYQGSFIIE